MAIILVVEDDAFIRDVAEILIRDWGNHILSACDVNEALLHLRNPQTIDALFTDIYLKTEIHGGCDLAREAIRLRPDLRILYTTGNRVTEKLQAMFAKGAHFLQKPHTEAQLQGSVETLLAV